MTVKIKWYQAKLDKLTKEQTKAYLIQCGEAGANQFSESAPKLTGLLKNSCSYHLNDGTKGEFRKTEIPKPEENDRVSKPSKKDSVRIGSALIYAARREKEPTKTKSQKWATRAWDALVASRTFETILKKVFKI